MNTISRKPSGERMSMPVAGQAEQRAVLHGLTGYINAGGRGTRLSSIFHPHERRGISKALLPIGRPPISLIEHQINKLSHAGLSAIIAGVGDHENVARYVNRVYAGSSRIRSIQYQNQLGNGGDLVRAVREWPEVFDDDVLITNVDTLLDIDEANFFAFHRAKDADLSIALTLNRGVPNEGAYYVGDEGKVIYCGEANKNNIRRGAAMRKSAYRGSSTGALIAKRSMLHRINWQPEDGTLSLYKEVVGIALANRAMYAFNNGERLFTDVGTVDAWHDAQARHATIAPHIHYANQGTR